jgi:hypothetical protein
MEITDEAVRYSWSARLDDPARHRVDPKNLHLVVPFVANGSSEDAPPSHRCYLWYKHVDENRRSCVVIDVADSRLDELGRPSVPQYDRLILMLVEQLPIEYLDPFK